MDNSVSWHLPNITVPLNSERTIFPPPGLSHLLLCPRERTRKGEETLTSLWPTVSWNLPPLLYLLNRKILLRQLFFPVIHLSKLTFCVSYFALSIISIQNRLCLTKVKCIFHICAFHIHTYICILYISCLIFRGEHFSHKFTEVYAQPH